MSFIEFCKEYGPQFLDGTWVTIQLTFFAALFTLALAFTFGILRQGQNRFLKYFAATYIEVFRGTSLLVQLFWVFFVLPLLGLTLDSFTAGVVTLGLNIGSYGAELVRGAIGSVPKGQLEAAIALNMSPATRMRRVILPQAVIIMLPAWGNLFIELLKGSALVALISVADLMFEAKQVNSSTFLSVQSFGMALIIYYVIARFLITPAMRRLEKIMARKTGMGG